MKHFSRRFIDDKRALLSWAPREVIRPSSPAAGRGFTYCHDLEGAQKSSNCCLTKQRSYAAAAVAVNPAREGRAGPVCRPLYSAPWCPVETSAPKMTAYSEASTSAGLRVSLHSNLSYEDPTGRYRYLARARAKEKSWEFGPFTATSKPSSQASVRLRLKASGEFLILNLPRIFCTAPWIAKSLWSVCQLCSGSCTLQPSALRALPGNIKCGREKWTWFGVQLRLDFIREGNNTGPLCSLCSQGICAEKQYETRITFKDSRAS